MVLLSWIAAAVACLGYGVGSVLQSVGARRTAHVTGVTGAALILVQLPYLLGVACDGVAFAANVVALQELPLFLVQSIVTASVGVTAVIAGIRGERLGWRDWLSLSVLGIGLILLSLTANAESAVRVSHIARWVILGCGIVPVVVGLLALRLPGRRSSLLLAAAAGLAWTGVAVAARGVSAVHRIDMHLMAHPLVWTILIHGVIGMVFFALALQRGSVTAVTAMTFVIEMVLPSAIGLWLFGDTVANGNGPLAVIGFVLAIGGTLSLMRFAD